MDKVSIGSRDQLLRLAASAVFATALMPFLSPLPWRGMGVQLTADIVAVLVLLAMLVFTPRLLTISKLDLVVLSCGLVTLFYVDFTRVAPGVAFLRACGTILFGFPVYFAVRNLYRYVWPGILVVLSAFYLSVLAFQLAFPRAYIAIFSHFLSEISWEPSGYRGPNGACVEPSALANMCILFVISMYFFHRSYWAQHRLAAGFIIFSSATMLLASQSATGIVLTVTMAFLALLVAKISAKVKFVAVTITLLLTFSVGTFAAGRSSRGAEFVAAVVKDPMLVVRDGSFAMRFVGTVLALHGLSSAPLGTGELVLDQKMAAEAWESSAMKFLWPDPRLRQYIADYVSEMVVTSNASGIGPLIQRMGLIAFLVLGTVVACVRGFPEKWVVRVFVVSLLLNSSLFISTLWFIIGCCAAVYALQTVSSPAIAPEEAA